MNRITININDHKSEIYVGLHWEEVKHFLPDTDTVIITDDNVKQIYGRRFPSIPVISIKPGEDSKNISTIAGLAKKLLGYGIDRSGFIVGIGGGVVCDITGFLASIYMRGIRFGFVSTSLLSQVDASVGGKNAVNSGNAKNILGCFRQPEFVICDPEMLATLPEEEYLSGLAELIKMGAIMDSALIRGVEQNIQGLKARDTGLLEYLISVSLELKASVVREDEQETSGKRMILNFGHTFGHAIETEGGLKHGLAVAAGMVIASDISVYLHLLDPESCARIKSLLSDLNLLRKYHVTENVFEKMLTKDKKKQGENINFILLESLGKAIVRKMKVSEIMEIYRSIRPV